MSDSSEPKCPLCKGHTRREALESQGVVLSAVEAFIKRDDKAILAIDSIMSSYDTHCAISLYALAYMEIAGAIGVDPMDMIAKERNHINAKLAELSD